MSAIDDRRAEQRKLFEQERDVALIAAVEDAGAGAEAVAAVLTTLAEQFRINGKLLAEQKAKGWKGEVETGPGALLACADRVDDVAKSVRLRAGNSAGLARMAEIRDAVVSAVDAASAGTHGWDADRAAIPAAEPASAEDVTAYLRGDTNVMPELGPGHVTTTTAQGVVMFSPPVGGVTAEAVAQSVPPPLVSPGGFDDNRIRFTLDRIIELGKEAVDARRSHTRGTSYSECGFRYAMRHHEVPAWWNVGGTAFHAFAEDVERGKLVCQAPDVTAWCRTVWESIFEKVIDVTRAEAEQYGVPGPATWRAAKHGKENRDWWRVEGAAMCETYLWVTGRHPSRQLTDADLASHQISGSALMRLPTAPTPARDGKLMLEFPLAYDVEGVHWQGIIDRVVWDDAGSRLVIVDAKGLALTTPLPTPTGWTTMGDVEVGDQLFGSDGKPCTVTLKSEVKRIGTYVVTFDDGSQVVCDSEHIWWTDPGSRPSGRPRTIGVEELRRTLVNPSTGQKHHRVPVAGVLELPEIDLPIDPYLLGCWLGDGHVRDGCITHRCDSDKVVTRSVVGLTTALRASGLKGNKHIPDAYLRASADQRLRLLQGLMDTDGTWNRPRQSACFSTVDKALAVQVGELVATLGARPSVGSTLARGYGKEVTAYKVEFTLTAENPFRLPRKRDLAAASTKNLTRARRRVVVSVEPGPDVETACVAVDSPNRTYLCGEMMIPTHNTGDHEPGDPSQLVDYAHVLRRQYSVPDWIKIDGLFYMARKGSVIVYEGLEAIESWESFAYRVKTVDRGIREGIFLPNVGLGCNSCGAKAICPAQGSKK